MAGVIDEHGQWERCNVCCEFTLIGALLYEPPSAGWKYGRDICGPCAQLPAATQDAISERRSRELAQADYRRYCAMGWDVTLNADNSISIHSCA
jgi:hypothetical protein